MSEGGWTFGELSGPTPPFDAKADGEGNCGFICRYCRQGPSGVETRDVRFRILERSRLLLCRLAPAGGVDKLLHDLVVLKQSHLSRDGWDPRNMAISYEELEQLYKSRERALLENQRDADDGELL